MADAIDVSAVMRLLGRRGDHPLTALRYRSVLATHHLLDQDGQWWWGDQPDDGDEVAGFMIGQQPLIVGSPGGASEELLPGTVGFLHPHRAAQIAADAKGEVMCLWVSWDALDEVESGVRAPSMIIPQSPLSKGLQAFLGSLLTQPVASTMYSDYLVERMLAEMAFGVLVEAAPRSLIEGRNQPAIDRARSLMLIRRSDPDFNVAVLAQEMHVSTRQLQRIFAAEQSSPADELRGLRVDLARELMSDPNYAPLRVEEIATHAGFSGSASLRRALAAAGLPSPRAVRP